MQPPRPRSCRPPRTSVAAALSAAGDASPLPSAAARQRPPLAAAPAGSRSRGAAPQRGAPTGRAPQRPPRAARAGSVAGEATAKAVTNVMVMGGGNHWEKKKGGGGKRKEAKTGARRCAFAKGKRAWDTRCRMCQRTAWRASALLFFTELQMKNDLDICFFFL